MPRTRDAVVIGGGHNGLVTAAYLAKAGRDVVVLEKNDVVGGAAQSREVFPGFTFSVFSYVVSLFRPHIIRELDLADHGLELIPLEASFTPYPDGRSLCRWADPHETRREIARFSARDAEVYPEFGLSMARMSHFVKAIIDQPPPDPASLRPKDLLQMLRLQKRFAHLSDEEIVLHLRMLTMSSSDFLDRYFESDELKSPMAVSGIIGTFLGVRSPGTAYVLLHHYMGEIDGAFRSWGFAKGGTGAVSQAVASSARALGAEIRLGAKVDRITYRDGRATGVVLEDGEEIPARTVVSSVDPRLTFHRFLGEEHLPDDFNAQVRRYRFRGSSGKVNLALDHLPDFTSRPGAGPHLRGDIAIAPSIETLERAYDDAKYGSWSRRPYLNVVIPSLVDGSVAPPGKHVMSIFVQYAPYDIEGGAETWPDHREAFGDTVVETLAEYCPGLPDAILHRQVLTPWDIEQQTGLTEGNIFQGELGLDQLLFLRPVPGWSRYRTPVKDLWMCGSATHPGGGVMGAPGELAAKTMLSSRSV